jgi:hypothetical protein
MQKAAKLVRRHKQEWTRKNPKAIRPANIRTLCCSDAQSAMVDS